MTKQALTVFASTATALAILAAVATTQAQARDEATRVRRALPEAVGACTVNKVSFSTSNDAPETTSQQFVVLPGSRRSITTTARGCILVDFSGEVDAAKDRIIMRAMAVGHSIAEPGAVRLGKVVESGFFETRGMRFIFPSMPAGTYDIRLEWLSEGGESVRASARTMTVQYR